MRILVDYRPALRERTGVGEYVHQTATALVTSAPPGESLVLFSASWKDRLAHDAVPGALTVDRSVPVQVLNYAWHRLGWPPVERLAGAGLDVVMALHPLLIPSRTAAQVVTVHDLDFLDHPERTIREIRRDYPALAASHARQADHVVVNSAHTARDVEARMGVPRARISVCSPGAPSWPMRDAEPSDGVILFLGTLEPRKNLGVLVDAYESLVATWDRAPRLVLAGRVTTDAAALAARVEQPPLAGRVLLPGYIAPDRRLELFRQAAVFVMPSHTEGFGMPVVEAMMAGVPVVAANRGALPEVAGDAAALVEPDDAGALAHVLKQILTDEGRRRRMSEEGRRQAEQFTWASTAERLRAAWHLAVEHRRVRRG